MSRWHPQAWSITTEAPRPDAELVAELARFPTTQIADGGGPIAVVGPGIGPMVAATEICGPAVTLWTAPGDILYILKSPDLVQPGDALVIDGAGRLDAAVIGDVIGGRLLVDGSIGLARGLGILEAVIGLTIVAVGTSMPELVTSVLAALRRQSEVALGNVLGSNMYNVLGIAGVTAIISPTGVPAQIAGFDTPVMVAVSILLLVVAATGLRISRREGAALLAGYVLYIAVIWPK